MAGLYSVFARLPCIPDLEILCLDNSDVTDAGLEYLKGMNRLQHLTLESTGVTDGAIVHLKRLVGRPRRRLRALR